MSHSYTSVHCHCVFSTKLRSPQLSGEIRDRLFPYFGGIARQHGMKLLEIGGVETHVHFLLSLPAALPLAKAIQLLKGGSCKWIHDTFPALASFSWQEGYGAFSIGISQVDATIRYIRNQEAHHRTRTFEEEYKEFLDTHGVLYDPKYVFG